MKYRVAIGADMYLDIRRQGDPGRTCVASYATQFLTYAKAEAAIAKARKTHEPKQFRTYTIQEIEETE